MRATYEVFSLLLAATSCLMAVAHGQDSPSLGDAARQARQQKQKQPTKDAQGKEVTAPKTPKVITNDEIPEHAGSATHPGGDSPLGGNDSTSSSGGAKLSA